AYWGGGGVGRFWAHRDFGRESGAGRGILSGMEVEEGRDERASVNACKSRGWWDAEMIISLPSVRHLYSFMSFSSEIFFNIYF
ncbi:hypothetical protein, partial [Pseudomonas aeruginosa]|uniref:hypothetical protein n=3 Tax=Pseudomonas aeruginosa TaxID=287 RepID=UPI0031B6A389